MVKSLKFLRHRRTEAGYFSEFLIAKTEPVAPVAATSGADENRRPAPQAPQTIIYSTAVAPSSTTATSASAMIELQQPPQPQLLYGWPATTSHQEIVISVPQPPQPLQQPPQPEASQTLDRKRSISSSGSQIPLDSVRLARRRERNRAAAAKCRQRRQDRLDSLAECVRQLEASNDNLEAEVADLLAARARLEAQVRAHQQHCQSPDAAAAAAAATTSAMTDDDDEDSNSSSSVWLQAPLPQTPSLPVAAQASSTAPPRPSSLSLSSSGGLQAPQQPSLTTPRFGDCGSGLTPFLLSPQSAFKLESAMLI